MARIKRTNRTVERVLIWNLSGERQAKVEMRLVDARAWYDSPESHDPDWLVADVDMPGCVLAARLTLA